MKPFKQILREATDSNSEYGTENDPRLDITKEYKTSESDPALYRAMTAGEDPSYMGLTGKKGKNQYGEPITDPEEKQRRRAEAVKRAHKAETQKRRERLIQQHISLKKPFSGVYVDVETGEQRHGRSYWPPSGPWIHPWTNEVVNNFVPIGENESVLQANPPRYRYPTRIRK
mgnify:CR=1 FL=1